MLVCRAQAFTRATRLSRLCWPARSSWYCRQQRAPTPHFQPRTAQRSVASSSRRGGYGPPASSASPDFGCRPKKKAKNPASRPQPEKYRRRCHDASLGTDRLRDAFDDHAWHGGLTRWRQTAGALCRCFLVRCGSVGAVIRRVRRSRSIVVAFRRSRCVLVETSPTCRTERTVRTDLSANWRRVIRRHAN
jgi:hypothetical protein